VGAFSEAVLDCASLFHEVSSSVPAGLRPDGSGFQGVDAGALGVGNAPQPLGGGLGPVLLGRCARLGCSAARRMAACSSPLAAAASS